MKKIDEKKLKEPEVLILLQDVRVREHGEEKAVGKKAGSEVTVSGMDKAELYYRGLAAYPEEVKKTATDDSKKDKKDPK